MSNETRELVKKIVDYCVRNGEFESSLLYPNPGFNIEIRGLFDFLSESAGISKADIGTMVDEIQATRKAEV